MMKKIQKILLLVFFGVSISTVHATETGSITVDINGFKNEDGTVRVAMANSRETHPENAKAFREAESMIEGGKVEVVFTDIPYGEYSIRLYHDKNGNKELDKNVFGVPKEPYGYSNNARAKLSAPSWKKAMFKLDSENVTQKIDVK
ncbi:MAG: DUF2141 domain-containing protein [Bacteroidetes bacterium]|nr:MAG: DUF2141 domain-containing protein [Bacteroidota bacterium]